jgi:hypothetical protein
MQMTKMPDNGCAVGGYLEGYSSGYDAGFIYRYNSEGVAIWSKTIVLTHDLRLKSLAETSDGGIIATGWFWVGYYPQHLWQNLHPPVQRSGLKQYMKAVIM